MAERFSNSGEYKDVWAAVGFVIQFILCLGLAGVGGGVIGSIASGSDASSSSSTPQYSPVPSSPFSSSPRYSPRPTTPVEIEPTTMDGGAGSLVGVAVMLLIIPTLTTLGLMACMKLNPLAFIWASLITYMVLFLIFAILLIAIGLLPIGIVLLFFFLILCIFAYCARKRVRYASVLLRIAITIIFRWPSIFGVTILHMVVLAVWCLALVFAIIGTFTWHPIFMIYWMFSYYWTSQCLVGINFTVMAGTAATWYFMRERSESPVKGAFKRTWTTSLGPVAFGSLLVALLKTLKSLVKGMSRGSGCLACCCVCIISCLEKIMRKFNEYAFTYVAIYGHGYIDAAKAVINLIQEAGLAGILNDGIMNLVYGLSVKFVAVLNMVVAGLLVAFWVKPDGPLEILIYIGAVLLALCFGLMISTICMSLINSCVKTIFVAYCEEPEVMQTLDPELNEKLTGLKNVFDEDDRDPNNRPQPVMMNNQVHPGPPVQQVPAQPYQPYPQAGGPPPGQQPYPQPGQQPYPQQGQPQPYPQQGQPQPYPQQPYPQQPYPQAPPPQAQAYPQK